MLRITIPETEFFDERTQTFINTKQQTLQLEHSLVSLSKWESKWKKPFISKVPKTNEETIDYIRCMTLTQNVDPMVYRAINDRIINQVKEYIDDPMTATWFNEDSMPKRNSRVITNELIYYWMTAFGIPSEYQKWHLNRLITLIRVCNAENTPSKKMSKRDSLTKYRALNNARRKSLHSKG